MSDIHTELLRRHYNYNKFVVWIDTNSNLATFPLYDTVGRLVGYQQYNPSTQEKKSNDPKFSRYFTYHRGVTDTGYGVVWGLDNIQNHNGTLFVTEGVFEAARLLSLGYDAVAILTSCPPRITITQLYGLGYHTLVWCGDNDDAGRRSKVIKMVDGVLQFDVDLDEVEEYELLENLNDYD